VYIYICVCVCVCVFVCVSLGRSVYELSNGLLRKAHEPKITGEKMTKF